MDAIEVYEELQSLIQLDVDAIHAYDQALSEISATDIRAKLTEFKADHERHIRELSAVLMRQGQTPPTFSPDFKGYFVKGFTALTSKLGVEGALKAMKMNEQLAKTIYGNASKKDFPNTIKDLVVRNFADEQRHFTYIETTLNNRSWESAGAQP